MNDYKDTYHKISDCSGNLSEHITDDGSPSLRSSFYKESFHSSKGAKTEALEKYLFPAEIHQFSADKVLKVLDVCVGLGYNTACLLEELAQTHLKLKWWGLEIDQRPLQIAIQTDSFRRLWSPSSIRILESIHRSNHWQEFQSEGELLIGDARHQISLLPKELKLDLIFLDPFSPSHCPELWTEEFLNSLAQLLNPNGRLITYCSAAAIRGSLRRAGLNLQTLLPKNTDKKLWSKGTIAIPQNAKDSLLPNSQRFVPLTIMEEEHLQTKAAIPYRDPSGDAKTQEIILTRTKEQSESKKESRSAWARRWGKA